VHNLLGGSERGKEKRLPTRLEPTTVITPQRERERERELEKEKLCEKQKGYSST